MNAPHPAEHIHLSEDEKKITYEEDQKVADAGTFTVLKEDHTLGNIVRMSLLRDGRVLFAGYQMPHPLENRMLIKIRTRQNQHPVRILQDHLALLKSEVQDMREQFATQLDERPRANMEGPSVDMY